MDETTATNPFPKWQPPHNMDPDIKHLKLVLQVNPNSEIRAVYDLICQLEGYIGFLKAEYFSIYEELNQKDADILALKKSLVQSIRIIKALKKET